jgi:hypothetical protein
MFSKNQQQKRSKKPYPSPLRYISNPWLGYDAEVTPLKVNLIKPWSSITKQSEAKGQNRIKIIF